MSFHDDPTRAEGNFKRSVNALGIWGIMILLLWLGHRLADWRKKEDLVLIYALVYAARCLNLDFLRLDASHVRASNGR